MFDVKYFGSLQILAKCHTYTPQQHNSAHVDAFHYSGVSSSRSFQSAAELNIHIHSLLCGKHEFSISFCRPLPPLEQFTSLF